MIRAEMMHAYVGHWVHCHSIYGVHQGVVSRVLEHGIVLSNVMRLANDSKLRPQDISNAPFLPATDHPNYEVQFMPGPFPPAVGGLFIPYTGIYGIYPFRPGFFW